MKISVICIAVIIFGVIIIQSFMPAAEHVVQGNTLTFKEFLLDKGIKINDNHPNSDMIYKKVIIRINQKPEKWEWHEMTDNISARWIAKSKDPSDTVYYLFMYPWPQK